MLLLFHFNFLQGSHLSCLLINTFEHNTKRTSTTTVGTCVEIGRSDPYYVVGKQCWVDLLTLTFVMCVGREEQRRRINGWEFQFRHLPLCYPLKTSWWTQPPSSTHPGPFAPLTCKIFLFHTLPVHSPSPLVVCGWYFVLLPYLHSFHFISHFYARSIEPPTKTVTVRKMKLI